jgi:DNA polymerase-3 subunit delta
MPPAKRATRATVAPDDLRPAPVVLVTGAESVLAERAVAALVAAARADDQDLTVAHVDAAAYEPGSLTVALSPSLFGGGIVVVASGVEAATEAFVKEASAYLAAQDPEVCLVLRHGGGVRAKALLDAARAAGAPEAACLPLTRDDEKADFAAAEFRRAGVRADTAAVRALVDAVGSDVRELSAACRQLAEDTRAVAAQGATVAIDATVVERYFGGRVEASAFKVADAAIAGRSDQALALLRHALDTGADPVPIVAALAMKVRSLAKVSGAGRGSSAVLSKELGLAPWQIDRARRELSGWSQPGIASVILALAEADTALKGGGRDRVYAVERVVLSIAHARNARSA